MIMELFAPVACSPMYVAHSPTSITRVGVCCNGRHHRGEDYYFQLFYEPGTRFTKRPTNENACYLRIYGRDHSRCLARGANR